MPRLVFIPGLGYDHRIFDRLSLNDFERSYINWIEPLADESIEDYATRLYRPMAKKEESVVLIGHSFGGILSQEIARIYKIEKVILLSSIRSGNELPLWIKALNPFQLYRLPILKWSKQTIGIWGKNHGFETNEKQSLFRSMVNGYSPQYFRWALKTLSRWRRKELDNSPCFQIHGTKDKTFPFSKLIRPDVVIENGSHVFMMEQDKLTTEWIRNEL